MRFDDLVPTRSARTLLGKVAARLMSRGSLPSAEDVLISQEQQVFLRHCETVFRLLSETEKNNPRAIGAARIRELSLRTGIEEKVVSDAVRLFCSVANIPEKAVRPGPSLKTVLQKMPVLSHATIRLLEAGEAIAKLLCSEYVDSSHFLMAAMRHGSALTCVIDRYPELSYPSLADLYRSERPAEYCVLTRPASLPLTHDGLALISHLHRGLFDEFSSEGRIVLLALRSSQMAAWRLLERSGLDANKVVDQVRELERSRFARSERERTDDGKGLQPLE